MNHKEEYTKNRELLEKVVAIIPEDNQNHAFFANYLDGMARAVKNEKDVDDVKWTFEEMISHAALDQAIFVLYRLNLVTDDIEKEWRALRPIDEVNKDWKEITDKFSEEREEIEKKIADFKKRDDDLGKFQSVATGRSKSFAEAENKAKEYNERVAAAQ